MRHSPCPFCVEYRFPQRFADENPHWPYDQGRIVAQNKLAFAIPGLGAQVAPYVLAISKTHAPSFLRLRKEDRRDLLLLLKEIKRHCPGSSFTVFEHGGIRERERLARQIDTSCNCVNHAHLHFVILDLVRLFGQTMESWGVPVRQMKISLTDPLPDERASSEPYLFFADHVEESYIEGLFVKPPRKIRQVGRRLVLWKLLGSDYPPTIEDLNSLPYDRWDYPFCDVGGKNMRETYEMMK